MGTNAYAELGYGVVVDEDIANKIVEEVFDEDDEDAYFTEYVYDIDELEYISSGADGCERFVVCLKNFTHGTDWGQFLEIKSLPIPEDLSALDKFCDKHNLKKEYAWQLGAYLG